MEEQQAGWKSKDDDIGEALSIKTKGRGQGQDKAKSPEFRMAVEKELGTTGAEGGSPELSSHLWYERMSRVIPWGSSTCSKAPVLIPEEPGVIVRGNGCRVWDMDGKEYIDFRNGLGPVTLGYRYPAVDDAIRAQLDSGISFGHPHPLEGEVAEMLCELIPCAEQVRFMKTGGEAIAAAIRLARHYTGRDHIVQVGYNGWLNSLAAGGSQLPGQSAPAVPGVPRELSSLHHAAGWNDLPALERLFAEYNGQIAAVVVAADYANMEQGRTYYPALRELTRKHGSLLIFDEIVTGFRIALGGVQQYFDTIPDLAVYSKGLANGMPLSVFAGRKEVMACCDRGGTVISSTFGGETLSLAAAKACINTYVEHDVVDHLWHWGEKLWSGLNRMFEQHDIPLEVRGFWPCPAIVLRSGQKALLHNEGGRQASGDQGGRSSGRERADVSREELKERFFRFAYKHGLSLYNVSYVNFSHREQDIVEALSRMERVCTDLKEWRDGR
ncbi:aminotransferase class III-fold pyridoxal phosphate-dependent enzyme [Paenibacillus sp. J2TS4]|uniref:aminotransferase class III-fold pyridoxal phosphate-dependent enzyme n=1 Tax=Paenibacillus sp. J2TS4 TaxID=2807194 RepID=UPI001B295B9C|nr:aminotransferase class III-fold pyridoxal phosphate-dependent enzyme [Paenibacillus sp. J2TS4]GIP34818.1 glutamate-1-semialdehyde 2,1-aminomutase [Paenibacillus sp. J2TS4]